MRARAPYYGQEWTASEPWRRPVSGESGHFATREILWPATRLCPWRRSRSPTSLALLGRVMRRRLAIVRMNETNLGKVYCHVCFDISRAIFLSHGESSLNVWPMLPSPSPRLWWFPPIHIDRLSRLPSRSSRPAFLPSRSQTVWRSYVSALSLLEAAATKIPAPVMPPS